MSGRQTRPGKMRDNNTLPEQFHPPNPQHNRQSPTIPPSIDKNALPIRAKPMKNRLSRSIRRAIRLREGGFAQTGRVIMNREGDNVRQTDTTWKNARQQHPLQTKLPSQNRSSLQIPNPTNHSRPFHPPDSKPPSQSGQNRRKTGSPGQSGG